jgi:hypothetical protein
LIPTKLNSSRDEGRKRQVFPVTSSRRLSYRRKYPYGGLGLFVGWLKTGESLEDMEVVMQTLKNSREMVFALCFATAIFATACGGGGGGGGGDDAVAPVLTPADVAYTGVRTEAYIDENNAEALVLGAFSGEDIEGIVPLATASTDATDVLTAKSSAPYNLSVVFKQIVAMVQPDAQIKTLALLDPAQECFNYPSGTLSDTLVESVSGTTNTLTGDIIYNNCDIGGVILDGKVSLSASIDLLTDDLTLNMTMNPLGYNDGITNYSLTGTFSGTMTTDNFGFLVSHLDLDVTFDNLSGRTFWLNDYVIDETEETSGLRSTISGRFYEHDYGFVDFLTDPLETIFVPFNPLDSTYDGRIEYTGRLSSHATLFLGVNQDDYCIEVVNASGVVDLGTCVP